MAELDKNKPDLWLPPGVDPLILAELFVEDVAEEQYGKASALNSEHDDDLGNLSTSAIARRELYLRFAADGKNIFEEAAQEVQLKKGQTLLEVGYGDGIFFEHLPPETEGHIIGIERASNAAEELSVQERIKSRLPNADISLLEMDGRQLEFDDESIDVVAMMFVLYHTDWRRLLMEAYRVLKPGGTLIAATRSPGNQGRLWGFIDNIAEHLRNLQQDRGQELEWHGKKLNYSGIMQPLNFYNVFPVAKAEALFPMVFNMVPPVHKPEDVVLGRQPRRQFGELHISGEEAWPYYLTALNPFRESFWTFEGWDENKKPIRRRNVPQGGDWNDAIETIVKPVFDQELAEKGYFTEYVKQAYFVCRKPLPGESPDKPASFDEIIGEFGI